MSGAVDGRKLCIKDRSGLHMSGIHCIVVHARADRHLASPGPMCVRV